MPFDRLEVKVDGRRAVTIVSEDDVEDVLERNKELRSTPQRSDWGRHVASVPNIVVVQWLNEAWERGQDIRYLSPEWFELVARKLADPDWAYLRVDK